jgi:ATP-dependent DNA helicase RecG
MSEQHIERKELSTVDSLPIRDTSLDDIDLAKVEAHIKRAVERGRYTGPIEPVDYLVHRRCCVLVGSQLEVTPAGILCFGRQPQSIYGKATVDLAQYQGIDVVSFEVAHLEKDIGGTIFEQIDRVEGYLWTNTHHGMTLTDTSAQRIELHEYPRVVIRELTVNMLAHRDYTNIQAASRVQLLRNRIEWFNPGGLPAGVTVKDLLAVHQARNPQILAVLYEAGYVEAIGQGIDTVVTVLKREGMEPPRFEDSGSFFRVIVTGKPPERFYDNEIYERFSARQRKILSFIRSKRTASPGEVVEFLGDDVTPRSVQRDVRVLAEANIITIVGTGRGTKYYMREDGAERS